MRRTVTGTDRALRLGKRIENLPQRLSEEAEPILLRSVQGSIRARAYRTGALFRSAEVATIKDAKNAQLRAFTFIYYGGYLEYGTRRISPRSMFRFGRDEAIESSLKLIPELLKNG